MATPLFRSASMDVFKSLLSKIDEISECQKQHCDKDNKSSSPNHHRCQGMCP